MAIKYATIPPPEEESLKLFHPIIQKWFKSSFKEMTPPQRFAFPLIHQGENVLIFSPTGSGKTLSGFLSIINELIDLGLQNKLEDKIYCIYISPLRALSNDIKRNLEKPLAELKKLAEEENINWPEIRIGVRTGDTSQYERSKMLKKPPHILITTPESLSLMLNAPKFSQKLYTTRWIIVDEVHELSDNKRGVHLSLSLERLQNEAESEFVRIGLSATQAPIEEIAKWLVGYKDDGTLRDCTIVNVYFTKKLDIKVLSPVENLLGTSFESATEEMYKLIKKLIEEHRTTLIFTNTRGGTERVSFKLRELFGSKYINELGAHHGSLGRDTRLDVEEKLKKGLMKAVVTSSSLELGIDIGYIDLVIQISSPKSVAKGLQRIGRAGHALNKPSKGRIIVFERDDLVECAVLVRTAYKGKIDRVQIPKNALDVLAQHLVGMSLVKRWHIDDAYKVVRRSYCYHTLPKEDFMSVILYLSGDFAELEDKQVYRKIWYDPEEKVFGRKRSSRMIYFMNIGTIPDEADYPVILEKLRVKLGNLSEPFVERLSPGDIFVLGGKTYVFRRVRNGQVIVTPAYGRRPTVPSWVGEMLPRSFDLSIEIGKFREEMERKLKNKEPEDEILNWLVTEFHVDEKAARSILEYFKEQLAVANLVPTHKRLVIEEFFDKKSRQNIVFHASFGRRTNDALSRAYAYVISNRINANVATTITDNGFMLTLPAGKVFPLEELEFLIAPEQLREILKKAIKNTELFKHRFRHCATRSFMILRKYRGHNIAVSRQEIRSQKVLSLLMEKYPDFPVIKETYREILEDLMDVEHAEEVLRWIRDKKMQIEFLPGREIPSPFAHSIILVGAEDVVIMEDRDALLRELHRKVVEKVFSSANNKSLFETKVVEKLIELRQFLDDETKGKNKEDILKILHNVGPMYLFRERQPSIFERMKAPKEQIKKWALELLKEKKITSIRLPKGTALWIPTEDFPLYYNAINKNFVLDENAQKIVELLRREHKLNTREITKMLGIPFSDLRLSLKVLEQMFVICKVDFVQDKREQEVVVWALTEEHLAEELKKAREKDPEEALEEVIMRYLKANGPSTPLEIATFTGHQEETIERRLRELEERGLVISGFFYALKRTPQFLIVEDREIIKELENREKGIESFPEPVIREFLLRKNRLRRELALESNSENILKILNEIGPVQTERALWIRLKNYTHSQLIELHKDKKVVQAKTLRKRVYITPTNLLPLFISLYRSNSELPKRAKKVLKLIEEKGPITRAKIANELKLSSSAVKTITDSLENELYIVRVIPEHTRSPKVEFIATSTLKIENTPQYSLADALEHLIYLIIKWYGPVPVMGITWLTKESYSTVEYILNKLLSEKKIVEHKLSTDQLQTYYILPEELKKIREIKKRIEMGEIIVSRKEVQIPSIFDPFSVRGIKQALKENYAIPWGLPILIDGVLSGGVDITIKEGTLYVKNIILSSTIGNDYKIIEQVVNILKDIGVFYNAYFVDVDAINSLPVIHSINKKITEAFLHNGFTLVDNCLLSGMGSLSKFSRDIIVKWLIRHLMFHPSTKPKCREDTVKVVKQLYKAWMSDLVKRIPNFSPEYAFELAREKKLIYAQSAFIAMEDISTWYKIFHNVPTNDYDRMIIDALTRSQKPLEREELIQQVNMLPAVFNSTINKLVDTFHIVKIPQNERKYKLELFSRWIPENISLKIQKLPLEKAKEEYVLRWLNSLGIADFDWLLAWSNWPFGTADLRSLLSRLEKEDKIVSGQLIEGNRKIYFMTKNNYEDLIKYASLTDKDKRILEKFAFLDYGYSRLSIFYENTMKEQLEKITKNYE
ncbi:MAG: ATP-dependent helicase, partial [Candidatus Odinarchaeota archaeon]|nr:ATP-dependent helicase [Candidatus Odinarchaeota archaeon]